MEKTRFEELLEIMFSDKPMKEKLKQMGMTEKELKAFMEAVLRKEGSETYNRIMAAEEKRVITPEAFGYMINLLNNVSLNKDMFEKIITLSLQLHAFSRKRIDKKIMDEIVNFIIFSGQTDITIRELIELFFIEDEENDFDEEIN